MNSIEMEFQKRNIEITDDGHRFLKFDITAAETDVLIVAWVVCLVVT